MKGISSWFCSKLYFLV